MLFVSFYQKVTKVARTLAAKSLQLENEQKSCTVMALLDGGTLRRHKSWLKVINIPVSTIYSYLYYNEFKLLL